MVEKANYATGGGDNIGEADEQPRPGTSKGKQTGHSELLPEFRESATTIYNNAVMPKRFSSSSDDMIDTSGETVDTLEETVNSKINQIANKMKGTNLQPVFLGDRGRERDRDRYAERERERGQSRKREHERSGHDRSQTPDRRRSREREGRHERERERNRQHSGRRRRSRSRSRERSFTAEREQTPDARSAEWRAERRADELIRQAEVSKAKIYDVPGTLNRNERVTEEQYAHSVFVDADYLLVGAHLDETLRRKIEGCQFVDFARLVPRDRVEALDDHRMVPVNENGQSYWVPFSERQSVNVINSYQKWELAFRVFSDVFTRKFPSKAIELIQYNHVIYTIAQTYPWDNVYSYDKAFREHMAKHPLRSWSIILQAAWNMKLNIRGHSSTGGNPANQGNGGSGNSGNDRNRKGKDKREPCWRYNRGRCTYGFNCRFEHKCAFCFKNGHGAHNCRKLGNDRRGDKPGTPKGGASSSK